METPNQPVESTQPVPAQPLASASQEPNSSNLGRRKKLVIWGIATCLAITIVVSSLVIIQKKLPAPSVTPTSAVFPTQIAPSISPVESQSTQLVLPKGIKVTYPLDQNIGFTYVGASIPNPNCFDCTTSTDILIANGQEEKKLEFLCGGISGKCSSKLTEFGYDVEMLEVTEESARVTVWQHLK